MDFRRRIHTSATVRIAAAIVLAAPAAGCAPRTPNSSAATAPPLNPVVRLELPSSLVMGEQSCASAACHGQAFDGETRNWQAAHSIWLAEDPHQRAFAVLYTERAVEMYRNLQPDSKRATEPPADIPYEAFLGERCLGCHATGLRGRGVVPLAEGRDRPAFYLAGVTCESCHGPASAWLDTHYLANFPRNTPGFHDTKRLHLRAEACVGCHVGPMIAANGKTYDMNHDLIAAGHPRLAFEFASYLTNLPKHWNDTKGVVAHQSIGQPKTFLSDAWAVGQEQVARQLVRQIEYRLTAAKRDPNTTPWPDFSNYDCLDCHHSIGPPGNGRTTSAQLAGRKNAPRPATAPLAMLRIMSGAKPPQVDAAVAGAAIKVENLLRESWQIAVAKVGQPAADKLTILTVRGTPPLVAFAPQGRHQQQAAWLLARMRPWRRPVAEYPQSHRWDPTWDEALQLYLGTLALAQDIEWQQPGLIHNAVAPLGKNLDQYSFRHLDRVPTQYDSPTDFDTLVMERTFDGIEAALINVTKFDPRPSTP